jgi:hypothetical protein
MRMGGGTWGNSKREWSLNSLMPCWLNWIRCTAHHSMRPRPTRPSRPTRAHAPRPTRHAEANTRRGAVLGTRGCGDKGAEARTRPLLLTLPHLHTASPSHLPPTPYAPLSHSPTFPLAAAARAHGGGTFPRSLPGALAAGTAGGSMRYMGWARCCTSVASGARCWGDKRETWGQGGSVRRGDRGGC